MCTHANDLEHIATSTVWWWLYICGGTIVVPCAGSGALCISCGITVYMCVHACEVNCATAYVDNWCC